MSANWTSLLERLTPHISKNFVGLVLVNTAIVLVAILVGNPQSIESDVALGWSFWLTCIGRSIVPAAIASILVSLVARKTLTAREIHRFPDRQAQEPPPMETRWVDGEDRSARKTGGYGDRDTRDERSSRGFDRLLLDAIQAIENAPDFDRALEATLRQICQFAEWDYGEAWVLSGDRQALQSHPSHYVRPDLCITTRKEIEEFRQYSEGLTFLPGEGLPGQIWTQLRAEWIENLCAEPSRVYLREPLARQCGFKAALGIPLKANNRVANGESSPILAILIFFILDPDAEDRHFVRFCSDVGSQLGAILAQKSLHDRFQAYLSATTDVMLAFDAQGYCLKIAPTRTQAAYRDAHGEVGRALHDIFDPDLARSFIGSIWQVLSTKATVHIEYCLTIPSEDSDRLAVGSSENDRDGKNVVWFSTAISPLSEDTVMWIARDITECKRVERALQEQKTYLGLVLDNIPQQVFWKDTNLVFRGCNQNWAKSAHLDRAEDAVGKTDYDLLPNLEMADFFRDKDRQVLDTDTPQLHALVSKQRPDANGQTIWLDVSRIPMHDAGGNIIGVVGVLEDITQRKEAEEALRREQAKSERLLLNVLPKEIANQLKEEEGAIASSVDEATVLFADIVGFTPLSARLSARELVDLLNQIFSEFDRLAESHGLEKIKTIGDAYMVAGGIPIPRTDSARAVAKMALDMQRAISRFQTDRGETFQIRIGINTGPVVAGVIGIKKFIYDLWGDTVNVASRMESTGVPGSIQVTETTYEQLRDKYRFQMRGFVEVKGKGKMKTYWLLN